jgi:hypothetical protein
LPSDTQIQKLSARLLSNKNSDMLDPLDYEPEEDQEEDVSNFSIGHIKVEGV